MTDRSRHRGFTLSETLAALAVAGLGVAFAVPGVQALAERNRQATGVNQLVTTLHLARSEAVMRNRSVTVCASATGQQCDGTAWEAGWITFVDADADGVRATGDQLLEHTAALPGLVLRSTAFADGLSFGPNGRIAGTGHGEFDFCIPGTTTPSRVVFVRASGQPALGDHPAEATATGCEPS